ncbi:thiamine-phosphate kinase [Alsobacter sp. SYSU M60028]|uniref:Thiamine-monophosphate kinase n=1 Tax=Alsobacter ponti TaxID=2962936 RepID=A0ABT1LA37_9HYPH|nr:thiamine-phosphate kinase [Alsobacter ponti]MCP8938352.1 thiamine-phosphate kinase [Alsobacter ponti]
MAEPGRPGEDELIARYFRPLAGEGAFQLLDDAATIRPPAGRDLVLTTDALVAGVHFFPDDPPDAIGWKALAVNLSDLAAKGAEPIGFLLSLALPPDWTPDFMAGFSAGLGDCAARGGCALLGGDTVRTPGPLTLSITALGAVPPGGTVLRTGARAGDLVFVSGEIGDAALGLRLRLDPSLGARLDPAARDCLLDRYLRPRPRQALAPVLLAHANGGMDVSDGLVGDATKMARASGRGLRIDLDRAPLSDAGRALIASDPALFEVAMTGGDDYEILCAVAPARAEAFRAAAAAQSVPVAEIGVITDGPDIAFIAGGAPARFARGSFSHF